MKTNTFIGLFAILASLFAGCSSYTTGLVAVDKDTAKQCGIEITHFNDNPFFAHIYYDYSEVENFNPANLEVGIVRSTKDDDTDWLDDIGYSLWEDNHCWFMMTAASSASNPHWGMRDAVVVSNKPGHLTIFSMDDIGTYVLSYKDKKNNFSLLTPEEKVCYNMHRLNKQDQEFE